MTGLSTFTRRTSISVNWQVSDPASPKFWDSCRCWTLPVPNFGTAAADPPRIWDCGRRCRWLGDARARSTPEFLLRCGRRRRALHRSVASEAILAKNGWKKASELSTPPSERR